MDKNNIPNFNKIENL